MSADWRSSIHGEKVSSKYDMHNIMMFYIDYFVAKVQNLIIRLAAWQLIMWNICFKEFNSSCIVISSIKYIYYKALQYSQVMDTKHTVSVKMWRWAAILYACVAIIIGTWHFRHAFLHCKYLCLYNIWTACEHWWEGSLHGHDICITPKLLSCEEYKDYFWFTHV